MIKENNLQNPRVLRLPIVQDLTGLKRSTIYLKMAQGIFPRPISIGPRAVGWLEEDISSWINSCIQKNS